MKQYMSNGLLEIVHDLWRGGVVKFALCTFVSFPVVLGSNPPNVSEKKIIKKKEKRKRKRKRKNINGNSIRSEGYNV